MEKQNIIRLESVGSTNDYVREHADELPSMTAVVADSQTAGRGQGDNRWESEAGKNLTFSIIIKPKGVKATRQFIYSKVIALAVADALDEYVDDISVKWPNDIYWRERKISGTLIECSVKNDSLKQVVIGTGVNINQATFSDYPQNPVSLLQILGKETDREEVLAKILENVEGYEAMVQDQSDDFISNYYGIRLFRCAGFHPYRDAQGEFEAETVGVEDDGHLILKTKTGEERRYAFKEVEFLIK